MTDGSTPLVLLDFQSLILTSRQRSRLVELYASASGSGVMMISLPLMAISISLSVRIMVSRRLLFVHPESPLSRNRLAGEFDQHTVPLMPERNRGFQVAIGKTALVHDDFFGVSVGGLNLDHPFARARPRHDQLALNFHDIPP